MSESSAASYVVRVHPELHELEVELSLSGLEPGPLKLAVPTWVPGAYGFMKYGRDLFNVRATDPATGTQLRVVPDGWSGFVVDAVSERVKIEYSAYAYDPDWGELSGIVDNHQAVLLGTRYLFAPSHRDACRVEYRFPETWKSHHPAGGHEVEPHTFEYPSYSVLLDTPVVAGEFERQTRASRGVPFHFVFLDRAVGFDSELEPFLDSIMDVAEQCYEIFGSYPFQSYSFIFTFNPKANWGLEHANATMIALDPNVFIDESARFDGLRVCAHELFHAWNVCRLKPAALMNTDHVQGAFTDGLWVSEGVTRYYEFLLCTRAGELPPERFLSNLVNYFRHHEALPACERVSPADSSRATFLNHNRYPGSVNNSVDYYDVGMLIAFGMDATLRLQSAHDSLDEAFSAFYMAFRDRGFTTATLHRFFGERNEAVGQLLVRETEAPGSLSTVPLLNQLGFEVLFEYRRYLGVVLKDNKGPVITDVLDTGPAARSGLAPGDELLRVNGFPFDLKALKWLISHEKELGLEVKRGTRVLSVLVRLAERIDLTDLRWRGNEAQLARWRRWLNAPALSFDDGQSISLEHYSNFHGIQTVY